MDFGYTREETDRFVRRNTPTIDDDEVRPPELSFGQMLDRIERALDADPMLNGVFAARFADRFTGVEAVKVSLEPFPIDHGTVLATIWDNQPRGRAQKAAGDTSRDKPARYALDIRACCAGHDKPLTTKAPNFRANVGDLFTPEQVRARIKRVWKGIDPAEAAFLIDQVLPVAEAGGMLVARLCLKRAAYQGGGTHWHPYHFALVSSAELDARAVSSITLIVGQDRAIRLPQCSTVDSRGAPFAITTKTTKNGSPRESMVLGQSRATELTSNKMRAWATGEIAVAG